LEELIWSEDCLNMAGFDWTWSIFFEGDSQGWTLRAEYEESYEAAECEDGEDCEGCCGCSASETGFDADRDTPEPVLGEGGSAKLFNALRDLIDTFGGRFEPSDALEVADRLKAIDRDLADGLRRHARRLARKEAAAKEAAAKEAAAKEAPPKRARKKATSPASSRAARSRRRGWPLLPLPREQARRPRRARPRRPRGRGAPGRPGAGRPVRSCAARGVCARCGVAPASRPCSPRRSAGGAC
jgi:hypothetical protein